jgi:hypothetical protein
MKWLKGQRTRLFGTIVSILGVVELYAREVIPDAYQGYILMGIGIAVIILRQITTTPPGERY